MSINESRLLIACETEPDVFADFSQPMDWAGFAERDLMLFDISDNVHRVTRYGNEVEKRLVSEEEENVHYPPE